MIAATAPRPVEDRFHFHPRATNPELWRTSLPLVVHERCAGHKGLIATWMAIHWLIVLHAAAGRRDFGVREIAARACVGRNELTGPKGYIQRLVNLGLLQIVGYDDRNGTFRAPRPVYHLDLWELERLSLELIPDVLRAQRVAPPPRPAPDPRQTSFLDALDAMHGQGTAPEAQEPTTVPRGLAPDRRERGAAHENGTVPRLQERAAPYPLHATGTGVPVDTPRAWQATHQNGTVPRPLTHAPEPVMHQSETALHLRVTEAAMSGQEMHLNGTGAHLNGTATPAIVPEVARNRDVEGGNEGANEGASESTRARAMLQEIAAQAAQVVLQALQRQGVFGNAGPVRQGGAPAGPVAPADQPALPDSMLALWQSDRGAIPARERHQLTMLAAELDRPTGGFGAYWVGRAILVADRCLAERGQALSVNYLRGMVRRWQREGSWGSDLESEAGEAAGPPPPTGRAQGSSTHIAASQAGGSTPAPQVAGAAAAIAEVSAPPHPALAAYTSAFGRVPNAVQAQHMTEVVTDLAVWRQVLTDWQANGWKEGAVANMLDRYRKEAGAPAAADPSVSVAVIHRYPNLTPEQRDRWIRTFHAAATSAEKRAVISRLEQEHPR